MQEFIVPDDDMLLLANSSLKYANSYLKTLENSLNKKTHFKNDLLYNTYLSENRKQGSYDILLIPCH